MRKKKKIAKFILFGLLSPSSSKVPTPPSVLPYHLPPVLPLSLSPSAIDIELFNFIFHLKRNVSFRSQAEKRKYNQFFANKAVAVHFWHF